MARTKDQTYRPTGVTYPTGWQYSKETGCGPRCEQRARRVETRQTGPNRHQNRHAYTVQELTDALLRNDHTFRIGRVGGGGTVYAICPRNAGPDVPVAAKAFGVSDRQALQNLADVLRVTYAKRCPR